ncbi:MAG: helix-turn-helix domain-containing protein [Chitinophagales bacterium]
MASNCFYCNALQKALKGNNFCSNSGDQLPHVGNNAFYIRANNMQSGQHLSRLTIRSVFNGYQYHEVEGKEHLVDAHKYLVVNEGQSYCSEIHTEKPIEALIIAFRSGFLEQVHYGMRTKEKQLLDNPLKEDFDVIGFFENTYSASIDVQQIFEQIRMTILQQYRDTLFLEELFVALLQKMLEKHRYVLGEIQQTSSRKTATKIELYKRISTAKDFMDAHCMNGLSLDRISQVATLSPYHFLRTFKEFYGQTPHQYLTQARLQYAHYLLQSSSKTIGEISLACGFESHSSFGRVFRRFWGCSPLEVRE